MNKVPMQFYGEPNANGDRDMIAPITTTDEVVVNPASATPITLTQKLNEIKPITVSATKPAFPCLWGKVIG